MSQQAPANREAQITALTSKVVDFAATLTAEEQAWLAGLLRLAAAKPDEVQGYLFKPFISPPSAVGGPTSAGPIHGDIGTPTASSVNGSYNPPPPVTITAADVYAAVAGAFGGLSGSGYMPGGLVPY